MPTVKEILNSERSKEPKSVLLFEEALSSNLHCNSW